MPKEKKIFCSKCNKHTNHKLKEFKSGKTRSMAAGQRRHLRNTTKGYLGKYKYVVMNKKQNKTPTYVAECVDCKRKVPYSLGKRMKKPNQS